MLSRDWFDTLVVVAWGYGPPLSIYCRLRECNHYAMVYRKMVSRT